MSKTFSLDIGNIQKVSSKMKENNCTFWYIGVWNKETKRHETFKMTDVSFNTASAPKPSFKDEKAFLPRNINKILGMKFPKYYLATHNDFWNFIYSLPSDFRSDVIMFLNLKKTKNFLLDNLETVDYLKSLHKEKYHNLLKRRK